jgi:hypothetical protein
MLHHVAVVRTDVSKECIASIIRVRIGKLGMLAVTNIRSRLQINTIYFYVYYTFLRSMLRLLVTANVPSSPILVNLMMDAILSSEMSVLTRATQRNIPEDGSLHSHRHKNIKSYVHTVEFQVVFKALPQKKLLLYSIS